MIVNEAFVRGFRHSRRQRVSGRRSSAVFERVHQHPDAETVARSAEWFEIVGVVRDFGLDLSDEGNSDSCRLCFTSRRRERCLRS